MYKLLLCLRYLRTRWIALASVISVMLGVATLIVVNSVMGGFAREMRQRVRAQLAEVIVEGGGFDGFGDVDFALDRIRERVGDKIEAMTPVVETLALLKYNCMGQMRTEPVHVIAIDPEGRSAVGGYKEFLLDPRNREHPSFEIRDDIRARREPWRHLMDDVPEDAHSSADPSEPVTVDPRPTVRLIVPRPTSTEDPVQPTTSEDSASIPTLPGHAADPFAANRQPPQPATASNATDQNDAQPGESLFNRERIEPAREMGIVIPYLQATARIDGKDVDIIQPGHDVLLALTTAGLRPEASLNQFTVVDVIKTGMSEYDARNCYVDLRDLQRIRGMGKRVTSIQIKLKNYAEAPLVVEQLQKIFRHGYFQVLTWEQKQGPLLSAVAVEQRILNIILFMIIAVAGFGILALFFMIVVEKTRDIGILKALGASGRGVQGIFLWYGLALGIVGSGIGMAMGLTIVWQLDRIEKVLSWFSGREIFDRNLYYFDRIPTLIDPFNIAWIVGGALVIAIAASVLPARRAAALRPVEALRYE